MRTDAPRSGPEPDPLDVLRDARPGAGSLLPTPDRALADVDQDVAAARRRIDEVRGQLEADRHRSAEHQRALEVRLGDERSRAAELERVTADLRRRAEAAVADARAAEARLERERAEHERVLADFTLLLDEERRRAEGLQGDEQHRVTALRERLGATEEQLAAERRERARRESALASFAAEREEELEVALSRARAEAAEALAARDAQLRELTSRLAEQAERTRATEAGAVQELAALRARAGAAESAHRQLRLQLDAVVAERQAFERALAAERSAHAEALAREASASSERAALAERQEHLTEALRSAADERDAARAAAAEAAAGVAHVRGQLELRERELAAARAEAGGATDLISRLQADLGTAHARLGQLQVEASAARADAQTKDAIVLAQREDAERRVAAAEATAQATLAAEREVRRAAFEEEARRLEAERTGFEQQLAAVRAESATALAGERESRRREREGLEGRVHALRAEVESTVAALQRDLAAERARADELGTGLRGELDALGAERDALRGQVAEATSELAASRERATQIARELSRREKVVARVSSVAEELRHGLAEVRADLAEETARRQQTDEAARRVLDVARTLVRQTRGEDAAGAGGPAEEPDAPVVAASVTATGAPSAASAPADRPEALDELMARFDAIRAQLAEQGVGSLDDDPGSGRR